MQGTLKAAGDLNASQAEIWYEAEKAPPWPTEKYERALNYANSCISHSGALPAIFVIDN